MRGRGVVAACLGAWLVAHAVPAASKTQASTSDPSRVLRQKLAKSGRAEARLERAVADPFSGSTRTIAGRLALEPPDRAEIKFPNTGERVTLQGGTGAWLQPGLKQMLVLGPEHAAAAQRWWRILMPGQQALEARALGKSRYVVLAHAEASAEADSAWVWLDGNGLPSRLELDEGGESRTVYRFSGWRFSAAKGAKAFTIAPPQGYEVVEVP